MTEEQQKYEEKEAAAGLTSEKSAPIVDVVPNSQKIGEKIDPPKQFAKNDPIMSKGEKVFDWSVYKGLNYWVNLISSLAIADYFLNPESSGRKSLNSAIEKSSIAIAKMSGTPIKKSYSIVKVVFETMSLTSGGWILLAPMKHLEDNKRDIVHSLNNKLGVDQTAPDGHKLTPDEIHIEKEQPKQSWGNVIMRRIYASVAIAFAGSGLEKFLRDKNTNLPNKEVTIGGEKIIFDSQTMGGKQRAEEFIVKNVNKGLKYVPVIGEKMISNPRSQRWIALAALDVFFTKITEMVMFATNGAKKAKMPHEIDNSGDVPSHDKIPDQIVPDEVDDGKKTNYSAKFTPRNNEKPLANKKSLAPEEFLGMNKGESAQVGFA
jgi:hypothetical protein